MYSFGKTCSPFKYKLQLGTFDAISFKLCIIIFKQMQRKSYYHDDDNDTRKEAIVMVYAKE